MDNLQTKDKKVNNTLACHLEFIVIPAIVVSLIGIPISEVNSTSGKFLVKIPAFLNVVLDIFDERKLKKTGYETKGLLPWAILFISIYLVKRRKLLKQKKL